MKIFDLVWSRPRRADLGDRDGLDLRIQAGLRGEHVRPRHRRRGIGVVVIVSASVLTLTWCSAAARSGVLNRDGAQGRAEGSSRSCWSRRWRSTRCGGRPFLWVASMSLRTTSEISKDQFRLPGTLTGRSSRRLVNSKYGVYFSNSLMVVLSAVAILTLVGAMRALLRALTAAATACSTSYLAQSFPPQSRYSPCSRSGAVRPCSTLTGG